MTQDWASVSAWLVEHLPYLLHAATRFEQRTSGLSGFTFCLGGISVVTALWGQLESHATKVVSNPDYRAMILRLGGTEEEITAPLEALRTEFVHVARIWAIATVFAFLGLAYVPMGDEAMPKGTAWAPPSLHVLVMAPVLAVAAYKTIRLAFRRLALESQATKLLAMSKNPQLQRKVA